MYIVCYFGENKSWILNLEILNSSFRAIEIFKGLFQPGLTTTAPIVTKFFLLWIKWSLPWQEQNCQVSESHEDPLRIYRALIFLSFHCFRHKKSSFFLTDVSTWCQQFHEIFKTKWPNDLKITTQPFFCMGNPFLLVRRPSFEWK